MAYRRRHGIPRASTFKEEFHYAPPSSDDGDGIHATNSRSQPSSALPDCPDSAFQTSSKDSAAYKYTSLNIANESKGFWGILAEKAKAILEEDYGSQQIGTPSTNRVGPRTRNSTGGQLNQPHQSLEVPRKVDNPRFRKGLDALTSSLNHIGDTLGNALEEGRTIVENKSADIMQETYNLQMKRRGSSEEQKQAPGIYDPWQKPSMQSMQPQVQTNRQTQLKATRDVAMATAAKAKLLLRELKTVKADLAFAKERCAQLEEENRILREGREKGIHPEDDDMIRFQLETLLAEKARLAHENSVYARENRFLREIVEYHQLTMQDVVYLDEGIEEVTEVGPIPAVARMLSISPPSPSSPRSPPQIPLSICPPLKDETIPPVSIQPDQENNDVS